MDLCHTLEKDDGDGETNQWQPHPGGYGPQAPVSGALLH
jgi:hypothetical protein